MAYSRLDFKFVPDSDCCDAFRRADGYLHDVYGMFRHLPLSGDDGGAGNYSMALVLLCVIDGFSKLMWPLDEQEDRFKRLIRKELPWNSKWISSGQAAAQLYLEFRNPLVHELAADKISRSRPKGFGEPVVGRWGKIPKGMHDISEIDALPSWPAKWPILYRDADRNGNDRYKLSAAGLYWAVKQLAKAMIVNARLSPR